jgi:hypothetical protein
MIVKIRASNFDVSPVFSWTLDSWLHGHYRRKRNIQMKHSRRSGCDGTSTKLIGVTNLFVMKKEMAFTG